MKGEIGGRGGEGERGREGERRLGEESWERK